MQAVRTLRLLINNIDGPAIVSASLVSLKHEALKDDVAAMLIANQSDEAVNRMAWKVCYQHRDGVLHEEHEKP